MPALVLALCNRRRCRATSDAPYARNNHSPMAAAAPAGVACPVMSQAITFGSTCPHCKREQLQDRFTAADLMRLLYGGYPIEAYCAACDESWPVSIQKRVELGDLVAAICALPANGDDRLTQRPPHG